MSHQMEIVQVQTPKPTTMQNNDILFEYPLNIARSYQNERYSEFLSIIDFQGPLPGQTRNLDQESSQIGSEPTQQPSNPVSFDNQQKNGMHHSQNSEQQNQFKRATPVQQKPVNKIPRNKNLRKIFEICKQHYQSVFSENQKIIAVQIIDHFSEQGTSDFMQNLNSNNFELLESWIKEESPYVQFLIKISFLYFDSHDKVQELLNEEKQIDVGVIKQKIIDHWNEFIDYLRKNKPKESIAKKQNTLYNFSEKKDIITDCTKNMAEFFYSKLMKIILEKLKQVYGEVINSFPKMVRESIKNKLIHLKDEENFKKVCLQNPQKRQILLQYRPLLELFLKKQQITSTTQLRRDFLKAQGIKEKIWGEILMRQKVQEKVKGSTRIGKFLKAYYLNFIEQLDKIRKEQIGDEKIVKNWGRNASTPKKKVKQQEQMPMDQEYEELEGKELSLNSGEMMARIDL